MDEDGFASDLEAFLGKYPTEGWEIRRADDVTYACNPRRVLPAHFDGLQLFANYYINLDQVFRVPVLSATFFTESGRQLTHDELIQIVPERGLDRSAISEREHEITGTPVFFIHPCKTDSLITPFVRQGADYLHCWLVRYGPVFFYRLPY
jgi:hypothetical protein